METTQISTTDQIRYAIGCAWLVTRNPSWRAWARAWVSGEDRAPETAWAVAVGPGAAMSALDAVAWTGAASARAVADAARAAAQEYGPEPLPLARIAAWAVSGAGLDALDAMAS